MNWDLVFKYFIWIVFFAIALAGMIYGVLKMVGAV